MGSGFCSGLVSGFGSGFCSGCGSGGGGMGIGSWTGSGVGRFEAVDSFGAALGGVLAEVGEGRPGPGRREPRSTISTGLMGADL